MESDIINAYGSSRLVELKINEKTLMTPTYFPAISSFGTNFSFDYLIKLLMFHRYPRLLISAYDWYFLPKKLRNEVQQDLMKYSREGFVFLDSGAFESYWKKDEEWKHGLHKEALSTAIFDFYTSLDIFLKTKSKKHLERTIKAILHSSDLCEKPGFLPIIHGTPDDLVLITKDLVHNHSKLCDSIAVSERDCGDGIIEKTRTIKTIRRILDTRKGNGTSSTSSLTLYGEPHTGSAGVPSGTPQKCLYSHRSTTEVYSSVRLTMSSYLCAGIMFIKMRTFTAKTVSS
jgi:hypothetical protein